MPVKPHPSFNLSEGSDQTLWRYMDFTKFLSLLHNKALFFARTDLLGDPFEGTTTQVTVDHQESYFKELSMQYPGEPDQLDRNLKWARLVRLNMRRWSYILCWHSNNHESAAMWKLYARTNEAVAIRTTASAFIEALQNTDDSIYVGNVRYVDYETAHIDWSVSFDALLHKRLSFAHENEVRAITVAPVDLNKDLGENPASGIYMNTKLETLIQQVHVAPDSPRWFRDLVEGVLRKYEIECPIVMSSLANGPLY